MANILNQDFTDFISALNQANVDYLRVGGYAVIFHGYNPHAVRCLKQSLWATDYGLYRLLRKVSAINY